MYNLRMSWEQTQEQWRIGGLYQRAYPEKRASRSKTYSRAQHTVPSSHVEETQGFVLTGLLRKRSGANNTYMSLGFPVYKKCSLLGYQAEGRHSVKYYY